VSVRRHTAATVLHAAVGRTLVIFELLQTIQVRNKMAQQI
jgi:hypothetical protein